MKKIWLVGLVVLLIAAALLLMSPTFSKIWQGNPEESNESSQEAQPSSKEEPLEEEPPLSSSEAAVTPQEEDWRLVLVSREHPLSEEYPVQLQEVEEDFLFDERAAKDLEDMLGAAWQDGIELRLISTYRSFARSEELFTGKVEALLESGLEYEEAVREAQRWIAPPGTSEHNTGLALDVVDNEYYEDYGGYLNTPFSRYPAYRWLIENAADFGFILRYPEDKEAVTGITYEPWHYRYVGREHAKEIMERGITLEEYLGF
ncbi:M15 family metallopeptidase [Harryflintia acetispora]|uniref:D-Ala-D-Ala carboxypeptidase n=1 Tax=Harryflintia acetispora TaxID=1849041 RepID=A0A9X8ULB5_9FIRM|nr:M15 family metallopeptidase [Harryflintia acetispora]TCL44613.1 D-Ala-D-Ala carboxypeptidase [Harryflintia acetispora]